jgi:hypothetical protein
MLLFHCKDREDLTSELSSSKDFESPKALDRVEVRRWGADHVDNIVSGSHSDDNGKLSLFGGHARTANQGP